MAKQDINQKILKVVEKNSQLIDKISTRVEDVSVKVEDLSVKVEDLSVKVDRNSLMIAENSKNISNILDTLQVFSSEVDSRFAANEKRLTRLEALMVTKDYLDEKLWDLRGDLVALVRREIGRHETRFHAA